MAFIHIDTLSDFAVVAIAVLAGASLPLVGLRLLAAALNKKRQSGIE